MNPNRRILILNTPLRQTPDGCIPFGPLAIVKALRDIGYDPYFLDIDVLRPPWEDLCRFIDEFQPEVVGISSVTSTTYTYTKRISLHIKQRFPDALIILGGNLAASAPVLLERTGVDICVLSEGELAAQQLIAAWDEHGSNGLSAHLEKIKGLVFKNAAGQLLNTGYQPLLKPSQIYTPSYDDIERFTDINAYIIPPCIYFLQDERSRQPKYKDKLQARIRTSKGCTNRCSFCHRWDKGLRNMPVDHVADHLRTLKNRYNIGFVRINDECFGVNKKRTDAVIALFAELEVLWQVGGVRVDVVDRDTLRRWKQSGCVNAIFGIETGSQDMLRVMEKNVDIEQNYRVLRWLGEEGIRTSCNMVIAMPGEDERTIKESEDLLRFYVRQSGDTCISINYAQTLPGSPLYEYGRLTGLIEDSLEGEEAYLMSVSDTDAGDQTKFINFTSQPYLLVRSWKPRLHQHAMHTLSHELGRKPPLTRAEVFWYLLYLATNKKTVSFFVQKVLRLGNVDDHLVSLEDVGRSPLLHRWRKPLMIWFAFKASLRESGWATAFARLFEYVSFKCRGFFNRRPPERSPLTSLRETNKKLAERSQRPSNPAITPLREGR